MDTSTLFALLDHFQAVYGRVYKYAAGTWWAWNVDERRWEHVAVKLRIARAFSAITKDLFPENLKLQRQVTRDYMIDRLVKGLVPGLITDTLPGDPFSQ